MDFIPHTETSLEEIKNFLNIKNVGELCKAIPAEILLQKNLNLPFAMTEIEIQNHLSSIKKANQEARTSFLGAGIYEHFIPSVVDALANRSEFLTAYTPYQAEISQGILQWIFEYQTCVARLFGMEIANASLYDGANSVFEAAKLAYFYTKKSKIFVSKYLHPEYIEVLQTNFSSREDVEILFFEDARDLEKNIDDSAACVIVSNPNFVGQIEELEKFSKIAHEKKSVFIVNVYPISLGILQNPGDLGADIVVAEGQSLGLPMCVGGATLGIFAAKKEFARFIPGRIVGETTDSDGKKGFVLTLQAREQHIRREKALSNICSNHANYALRALIYLASLGDSGLKKVAEICAQNAYYFANEISKIKNFRLVFENNFFNEFIIEFSGSKSEFDFIDEKLKKEGIDFGVKLEKYYEKFKNCWLVCTTEMKSKEQMDLVVNRLKEFASKLNVN